MGGRSADRVPHLKQLRMWQWPGWVVMAECASCDHMAPLPLEEMIRRLGEMCSIEAAMGRVRCQACGKKGARQVTRRLCEPGCSRQRG